MEASRVTVSGNTYDLGILTPQKKTNLRRKLVVEYIQSKPSGEYIKMQDFQELCHFSTYANTWAFIQRMIRDGVIQQHSGEKKKAYYYSVLGSVRVKKPMATPTEPKAIAPPNIIALASELQRQGIKFTLTLSNEIPVDK